MKQLLSTAFVALLTFSSLGGPTVAAQTFNIGAASQAYTFNDGSYYVGRAQVDVDGGPKFDAMCADFVNQITLPASFQITIYNLAQADLTGLRFYDGTNKSLFQQVGWLQSQTLLPQYQDATIQSAINRAAWSLFDTTPAHQGYLVTTDSTYWRNLAASQTYNAVTDARTIFYSPVGTTGGQLFVRTTGPIPETSTWAMSVVAFAGLIGFNLLRRNVRR